MNYPKEVIFELAWSGPYTLQTLKQCSPDYLKTICLYAIYQDHPLYGRRALTYIGKVTKSGKRSVVKRLKEHDLENEVVYVATIQKFDDWDRSDAEATLDGYDLENYVRIGQENEKIISRIEELLIYSLGPADNRRSRQTALNSWEYRLFNTGDLGSIPPEVSGHYALQHAPKPKEADEC